MFRKFHHVKNGFTINKPKNILRSKNFDFFCGILFLFSIFIFLNLYLHCHPHFLPIMFFFKSICWHFSLYIRSVIIFVCIFFFLVWPPNYGIYLFFRFFFFFFCIERIFSGSIFIPRSIFLIIFIKTTFCLII